MMSAQVDMSIVVDTILYCYDYYTCILNLFYLLSVEIVNENNVTCISLLSCSICRNREMKNA